MASRVMALNLSHVRHIDHHVSILKVTDQPERPICAPKYCGKDTVVNASVYCVTALLIHCIVAAVFRSAKRN